MISPKIKAIHVSNIFTLYLQRKKKGICDIKNNRIQGQIKIVFYLYIYFSYKHIG